MKIRNGFVSNSSSSSFVVAFLKSDKEIRDFLFHIQYCGFVYGEETELEAWWPNEYRFEWGNKTRVGPSPFVKGHIENDCLTAWKDYKEFNKLDERDTYGYYSFCKFAIERNDEESQDLLEEIRKNPNFILLDTQPG